MITSQLEQLLFWGVPKMTDAGIEVFQCNLEAAVRKVINEAFDQRELDAFHVTNMIKPLR